MASSMSLKWCKKNLEKFSQGAYDLLREEYPEIDMEVVDCADHCGLCTDVPFALRNSAVVAARDPRGLYVKLKQGMAFLTEPPLPGTYAAGLQSSKEPESVPAAERK
ncbi:MAG: YuzB family protein [Alicyclobacillus sp.]|nr:YuzB family protein [Alicyclobacillus sp.]